MILARRKFLFGMGGFLAAPAIVSIANLMPVSAKALLPQKLLLETDYYRGVYGVNLTEVLAENRNLSTEAWAASQGNHLWSRARMNASDRQVWAPIDFVDLRSDIYKSIAEIAGRG